MNQQEPDTTTNTNNEQHFVIEDEQIGMRLDRFLTTILTHLSRTAVQQLISSELVLVNDKPSKPGYALRAQDEIDVLQQNPPTPARDVVAQPIPLDIIYEDPDLLIVNKAAGMVVHPAPGHYDDTLVNALLAYYPEIVNEETENEENEDDIRPGIVHRLDRDTSGLLIVAKNRITQAAIIEQMKRHEIDKFYLALVEGVVNLDHGTIEAPIGRDTRNRQMMTITASGGRDARTHFRVQERFRRHTLLLLQLETGRTHQIRVHLKAINHPVVGDPLYGSGHKLPAVQLTRQFLHAYQLRFKHPISGQTLEFEAPLPSDLQAVLAHPEKL